MAVASFENIWVGLLYHISDLLGIPEIKIDFLFILWENKGEEINDFRVSSGGLSYGCDKANHPAHLCNFAD
jgi:hypothetical protein